MHDGLKQECGFCHVLVIAGMASKEQSFQFYRFKDFFGATPFPKWYRETKETFAPGC